MLAFRRSFRARLIVGAVVWIAAGTAVTGYVMSRLYRAQVLELFDAELDGHADELVALLELDGAGRPFLHRPLSDPRFEPPGSGFYWQVQPRGGPPRRSPSLGEFYLALEADPPAVGTQRQSVVPGPTGPLILLARSVRPAGSQEPVYVGIGADERLLEDILAGFNRTLAISLGLIALGLIGAAGAQIAYGLRPVHRIRAAIAAVRSGETQRLPGDLPAEVGPLVTDLNALIETNQEMIRRARTQAGNLAHALKTPLAILMDEGARLQAAGQGEAGRLMLEQCERMRRHIDYYLNHARAAATRTGMGAAVRVGEPVRAVVAALSRLHRDRGIAFAVDERSGDAPAACGREDLNEMLGNLIDNAAKWARSRVRVTTATVPERKVRFLIEDDGPGMPAEARERVFNVGERLDERAPGSGLGLAIVRDLADLYGGRVWIEDSALGGTAACLDLPLARTA